MPARKKTTDVTQEEAAAMSEEAAEVKEEVQAEEKAEVDDAAEPAEAPEEKPAKKPARRSAAKKKDETGDTKAEEKPAAVKKAPASRRSRRTGREATLPDDLREEGSVGINTATKKQRRDLYGGEDVFTINPDDTASTEKSERYATYLELVSSYKNGKILQGMLSSITTVAGIPCGIVYYNDYTILIPQEHLFVMDENIFDGVPADEQTQYRKYYASTRIGSIVSFIILQVYEDSLTAYGSVVKATEAYLRDLVFDRNSKGRGKINEGDIVEGRISYIMRYGIGVSIWGIETYIGLNNLSYLFINDCRTEVNERGKKRYEVGAKIPVKILSITPWEYEIKHKIADEDGVMKERSSKFSLVRITASAKDVNENPNEKWFNKPGFQVDDRAIGTITGRTEDGYFIRINGKRDALCRDETHIPIPNGTVVSVKISRTEPVGYRIFCRITGIVRVP